MGKRGQTTAQISEENREQATPHTPLLDDALDGGSPGQIQTTPTSEEGPFHQPQLEHDGSAGVLMQTFPSPSIRKQSRARNFLNVPSAPGSSGQPTSGPVQQSDTTQEGSSGVQPTISQPPPLLIPRASYQRRGSVDDRAESPPSPE